MDVTRLKRELSTALKDLQRQRDELDDQIRGVESALSSLSGGRPRGRSATRPGGPRKKPHWSPEARRAAAERMRKYWAGQKKLNAAKKKGSAPKAKAE